MFRKILWWAAQIATIVIAFVFMVSMCALDSQSNLPIITCAVSGALLALAMWRCDSSLKKKNIDKIGGEEDVG